MSDHTTASPSTAAPSTAAPSHAAPFTAAPSTADAFRLLQAHDPALMASLRARDPEAVAVISRVLRLIPLPRLAADPSSLVAALVAVPHLRPALQASWRRADPQMTARLFVWVEQASRHHGATPPLDHVAA